MDVEAPGSGRRADDRWSARDRTGVGDPLVGRLLDRRYQIGPRIARGGMASVYQATDLRLDRTVAVKVMHTGLGDDDEFAARFVREARSAARLSDTHVVGVFDQGEDAGTVFLVMEYVPGHTLRDVIRAEAPMPPLRALDLLDPVLAALAAAHRAGLIHRDVKPENVLISDGSAGGPAGHVKVADFGLAKAVSADTQHTATGGVLIGTVSYLAPEVVIDGRADARTDVYAAGVVLYELLTGRKPHEGETPIAVAYKHVHEDVPPPSRAIPGLPAYVDALVARATARDRVNRPTDAGVLRHQLQRVRHALAEGVLDDPELTADLLPPAARRGRPDDLAYDDADQAPGDVDREPTTPFDPGPPAWEKVVGTAPRDLVERTAAVPLPRPAPHPEPARARAPRRRSRRGLLALLLALLLVGGGGAAAWWFGEGRYEPTPGVLGLAQPAAVARLSDAGLASTVTRRVYSEQVAAGVVIATDPEPGTRVLHDGTVGLTVSLGKERYAVPALAGRTADAAQDLLRTAHLAFGTAVARYSETALPGTVIRTNPPPGTELRTATPVDLVVSRGRRPLKVQDFTGQDADTADRRLTRRGFDVSRTTAYDDTVPVGDVVSQTPDGGTLFKNDKVALVVSLGPEMVTVPDVVPMTFSHAEQVLEDAGFHVERVGILAVGYVFRTSPSAGTRLRKGSTIKVYVI